MKEMKKMIISKQEGKDNKSTLYMITIHKETIHSESKETNRYFK